MILYGVALAATAVLLQWLEYRYAVRRLSIEAYLVVIAAGFTALGIWAGRRLTTRPKATFERNTRAMTALGISDREMEVLELLTEGHTNKEIAERLHVSPHTVKSHVGHLFSKLEVSRRTQAVHKARQLRICP